MGEQQERESQSQELEQMENQIPNENNNYPPPQQQHRQQQRQPPSRDRYNRQYVAPNGHNGNGNVHPHAQAHVAHNNSIDNGQYELSSNFRTMSMNNKQQKQPRRRRTRGSGKQQNNQMNVPQHKSPSNSPQHDKKNKSKR